MKSAKVEDFQIDDYENRNMKKKSCSKKCIIISFTAITIAVVALIIALVFILKNLENSPLSSCKT